MKVENTIGFGSAAEYDRGLSSLDIGEGVKACWKNQNHDWGFGFEFTNRHTQVSTAKSQNSQIPSSDLQYTVASFPLFYTAYLPLKTAWLRPGLEFGAAYLLVNKTALEQEGALSLSPLLAFELSPHLELSLRGRVLIPLGGKGEPDPIQSIRFGVGPGVAWTF